MTGFDGFPRATLTFLRRLGRENTKEWFHAHRADYEQYYLEPAQSFVSALGPKLGRIARGVHAEPRVNGSIFRINRDMRFSKEKAPYKTHLDLWFWQGEGKSRELPGFFVRIAPTQFIVGAGLQGFSPDVLHRYRLAVDADTSGKALARAIARVTRAGRYEIGGAHYKTVPRGFPADHPRADLLRHRGLFAHLDSKVPRVVHEAGFVDVCLAHFKAMAPIQAWVHGTCG